MAMGRKGRDPRNKTIDLHNGLVLHLNYDGADEVLEEIFTKITAELLESARQVKELGELYDKQTAEHEKRIAEYEKRTAAHKAKTAEHEEKTAQNEIIAAQHAAKAAEYKAMSIRHAEKTAENKEKIARLEEVLIVAKKLGDLLDTGTDLLKTLTPRQIEFKKQVNQRAELVNEIAVKIKICTTLLSEGQYDELEKQVTLLEKDFEELNQLVDTENKAQDAVIEALDQFEAVVAKMESVLGTITHQQSYYTTLKEKSYDIELGYLEKENSALDANRPAKVGSDELGQQCKEALSFIKQRLQQQKEAESPSRSRTPTPPSEVKDSPLSKSRSDEYEDDDIIIDRSSPSSSSQSGSDDELKKGAGRTRGLTTSKLSIQLQSAESRPRSPSPQGQPPQPLSPTKPRPETPDASVALLGIHKPKPLTPPAPPGEGIDPAARKNNDGRVVVTVR